MIDGKDLLNRTLYRLIADGQAISARSNWGAHQAEWQANHDARKCISNILKQWSQVAA
jgi:hypothetical protein